MNKPLSMEVSKCLIFVQSLSLWIDIQNMWSTSSGCEIQIWNVVWGYKIASYRVFTNQQHTQNIISHFIILHTHNKPVSPVCIYPVDLDLSHQSICPFNGSTTQSNFQISSFYNILIRIFNANKDGCVNLSCRVYLS